MRSRRRKVKGGRKEGKVCRKKTRRSGRRGAMNRNKEEEGLMVIYMLVKGGREGMKAGVLYALSPISDEGVSM